MKIFIIILRIIFILPVTIGVLSLMNWGVIRYMEWFISLPGITQWFLYFFTFPLLFGISGVLIGGASCLFAWGNISKTIIVLLILFNSIYMTYILWDKEQIMSSIEMLFQALVFTCALMYSAEEGTQLAYPNNRRRK